MKLKVLKTAAFVLPLAGLALVMQLGERLEDNSCPISLAGAKSQQVIEDQPGVLDMVTDDMRRVDGCRFAIKGYADIATEKGVNRAGFEVVLAFDPQTRQWQQASLAMPR